MRRAVWAALILLAGAAGAQEGLPGIGGADDRVAIESQDWPWSAIGRINRATGGYCTGTLVGPRHVLTAAHCLQGHRHPSNIHFVAGYSRERYVGHAVADRLVYAPGYAPDRAIEPDTLARDWAVVVLRAELGIAPVPLAAMDLPALTGRLTDAELLRAGYSRDRAHILTAHLGCRPLGQAEEGRLLLHDCDATIGDSGSPLLLRRDGEVALVAMHVATGESDEGTVGVAVPATGFAEGVAAALAGP